MTISASQPPPDLDPESVHQEYLDADVRPAIGAAGQEQLRAILNDICRHLCRQLGRDMGKFPALGPDRRRPWEICEVGGAMAAGFQLHQHVIEAVTGSYLHVLGFDPVRASGDAGYFTASIAPFLAVARQQLLRRMLLRLHDHLRAVLHDSDTYAQAGTEAVPELTGDMWEIAAGVTAAIGLYRHCARTISVHVLFYIWDGLGIASPPHYRPYTPGPADPGTWHTTFN